MAFFDPSRPVASGFARPVSTLYAEFLAWREARLNRAALSRLSDHELADIGLQRSDIDDMARKTFGPR
jgi:uncharacterized protein YjiS (DUF1127 family)